MLRWKAKLICGSIILISNCIFVALPLACNSLVDKYGRVVRRVLNFMYCFTGGIWLAAYFVLMVPEALKLIEQNLLIPAAITFPVPDFVIGLGFFLFFVLVRTVNGVAVEKPKKEHGKDGHHETFELPYYHTAQPASTVSSPVENAGNVMTETSSLKLAFDQGNVLEAIGEDVTSSSTLEFVSKEDVRTDTSSLKLALDQGNVLRASGKYDVTMSSLGLEDDVNTDACSMKLAFDHGNVLNTTTTHESMPETKTRTPHPNQPLRKPATINEVGDVPGSIPADAIVLMVGLFVDGMAIGLKLLAFDVWLLSAATLIHESFLGFNLAFRVVQLKHPFRVWAWLLYLAMNPVGLLLTTAIFEPLGGSYGLDLANGILQAILSGCFLYVIFVEVLNGRLGHAVPSLNILIVFAGFVFLVALSAIPHESQWNNSGNNCYE